MVHKYERCGRCVCVVSVAIQSSQPHDTERTLKALLKQQRTKVEEIKKKTNYYSTRNLIERYDDQSTSPLHRRTTPAQPQLPPPVTPQRVLPQPNVNSPTPIVPGALSPHTHCKLPFIIFTVFLMFLRTQLQELSLLKSSKLHKSSQLHRSSGMTNSQMLYWVMTTETGILLPVDMHSYARNVLLTMDW